MFLFIYCYLADLIIGDPEWLPHPVRIIGKLISFLDKNLRGKQNKWIERIKGTIAALITIGISIGCAYFIIKGANRLNPLLKNLVWIYLGYSALSIKDLFLKAEAIIKEIEAGSLVKARQRLSQIVGRDTQKLSEEKIIKATIESVAENTNDGIVAPLFYLILGGPILAITYKAINTLDSMLGYKNEKYIYFGWFSAKSDDIVNFIPARITGLLISICSFISGKYFIDSFRIMIRDGRKHPSPNSGVSEAAMAGALGIKLGGPSTYQGKLSEKPYIGEDKKPIKSLLINEVLDISFMASVSIVLLGGLLKWLI
jgi:adenosylcobinamide-phosphate synthase